MNHHRHVLTWAAGGALIVASLLSSGCASGNSTPAQSVLPGAAAGAIIGGFSSSGEDRKLSEIQSDRRRAEDLALRERAHAEEQYSRLLGLGGLEDQQLLAARHRATAAEADLARLQLEEDTALRQMRQIEEFRSRETSVPYGAEIIRTSSSSSDGVEW